MADRAQSTHSGDLVTDRPELTLDDLCNACGLSRQQIEVYVAEGIIEPQESANTQWHFSHLSLVTLRRAQRLERDLGLNAAGVALAFDLMAQVEALKRRLARFEQDVGGNGSEN